MIEEQLYDVIKSPIYTEKATNNADISKYTFEISKKATKLQVKRAIEKIFQAAVLKVNILNVKGKKKIFKGIKGERSSYKKAIVTFEKGKNIEFVTGA